jgi:hypothetical protein
LELPVIFHLEQESNIEDFIAFEVFGNVSLSLEMPLPSQSDYSFHSFPVVD